jgi:hypothetical protein
VGKKPGIEFPKATPGAFVPQEGPGIRLLRKLAKLADQYDGHLPAVTVTYDKGGGCGLTVDDLRVARDHVQMLDRVREIEEEEQPPCPDCGGLPIEHRYLSPSGEVDWRCPEYGATNDHGPVPVLTRRRT